VSATPSTSAAPATPALCAKLKVEVVGHVNGPTELSGLVRSPSGGFWAHNDSGDAPRVFRLDNHGRIVREVTLTGATAVDWEDIAIRGHTVYIGDIGDNRAQRADIAVYRFTEGSANARKLVLRYPDGAHDAEALLVDPRSGRLIIVTKDFGGVAGVYVGTELEHAATLNLGLGAAITAGDIAADGRTIVLRSYDRAFVWTRGRGESVATALRREPCVAGAGLLAEGQGESLALTRDGRAFYTVPEGPNPPLRRYGD
jgi:hypothetical protein